MGVLLWRVLPFAVRLDVSWVLTFLIGQKKP